MLRFTIILFGICTTFSTIAQTDFHSEEFNFSVVVPKDWDILDAEGSVLAATYNYDPTGKLRVGIGLDISVYPGKFNGDLEEMAISYRSQLYSRPDMHDEEITSEEIVDFHGIKAIEIYGKAKIPQIKNKIKWRMYLFEHKDNYFEISFTARKNDFDKKQTQADFQTIFETFEFLE